MPTIESRFGDVVLWARLFYVNALVYLAKDTGGLLYGVSFFLHDSGRFLTRQNLIFNGPVLRDQVLGKKLVVRLMGRVFRV